MSTATTRHQTTGQDAPARGGRGWIAFAAVNALIIFFGLSYIFFPMGTVRADGNHTTGVLQVPREVWGSYVVASGLALLVLALFAFATRRRWARAALAYQFLFLVAVAAIEPDPVVPTVFTLVLGFFLYRARSWFDR